MAGDNDLESLNRLLETDYYLVLPTHLPLSLQITSDDVLHSFAVPALGVKLDACPGRVNSVQVVIKCEGRFVGQCSELCGVNHAFMPIVIQGIEYFDFQY